MSYVTPLTPCSSKDHRGSLLSPPPSKVRNVNLPRSYALILLLALVLSACSTTSEPAEPTVEPTATALPTISPGGTTVGDLVDRVNAAWGSVESLQTTFWTIEGEVTVTPPATGEVTVETSIKPDRRHVVRMVDGNVIEEQIAVGGRVFMRGQIVAAAIAPLVGPDAWIEVDPRTATSTSSIAAQVSWLLAPVQSPVGMVSDETRALEAFPGDPIDIDGRTCNTWTFGVPNGIQQELALDAEGLPCRLVQQVQDIANVTIFSVNQPGITIAIPPVATPTAP